MTENDRREAERCRRAIEDIAFEMADTLALDWGTILKLAEVAYAATRSQGRT